MEESDNMLLTTLREFIALSQSIVRLKDIKTEEIFSLSLKVLEYLKYDTDEIKSLSGKQQKFRSMAKLNQSLQTVLETQFELNELMNPSIPFLRKFILTLINKLGSIEGAERPKQSQKNQYKQDGKVQKQLLKNWLNEEWIHPSMLPKKAKYRGYLLPLTINKNMLKNNINLTHQLNNTHLKANTQSILNSTEDKLNQRVKEFEANEGFSRKEHEESQLRLQNIIKVNKDDWLITGNKLQKLKKKVLESSNDPQSEIMAPPIVGSVFKQQLEQAAIQADKKKKVELQKPKIQAKEIDTQVVTLNPLQLLKKQAENKKRTYENQMNEILNDIKKRKEAIDSWQKTKEEIELKIQADQQKALKVKHETVTLKKQVEKKQVTLNAIEDEKDVEEQVKKLEGQIEMIQTQVKQQVDTIQKDIKQMKVQSTDKMEALGDLKAKLTKIESQYSKICEQILQKQQLKDNVKIAKSGISRIYYHKKISEIEVRWRETNKETKKLAASLKELRQKTRISSTLPARVQTQIENILNVEKTKNEPQVKTLRQLMTKCRQTYQRTLQILEQVNQVKIQTQEYEVKVHTLSGKNFKQNIDRITYAMQDIKKQIAELSKLKGK